MRAIIFILVLLLSVSPWLNTAQARPGGGHSSSGHSSSSSSRGSSSLGSFSRGSSFSSSRSYSGGGGGSSSCFGKPYCTAADYVKIFIIFIAIIALFIYLSKRNVVQSVTSMPTPSNRNVQRSTFKEQLEQLKQSDENFSSILFLDFVHSLYNKFYSYATKPEFSYLSPFLSSELQQHFSPATPWTINEIVINGIQWQYISLGADTDSICVVIDANYTLHSQDSHSRYAVTERWLLYRQKGVLSAEPSKMQTLCCPHCGAPAQFTDVGLCEHCARVIHKGEVQWYLGKRVVLQSTALENNDLVAYAQEQGTQLATIKQSDLAAQMQCFSQLHNVTDWVSFWQPFESDIVKAFFLAIYTQWSSRDLQAVRHLLSDRLYEANSFWLALYLENNWHNRLDDIKIKQIDCVKIDIDKFYEAITVRIFASCYDYTEDANGKVIGGSKRSTRDYSEYWTFVRRMGVEQSNAPYSLTSCPQCGAPADNMGQTAQCGYCGSKISTGEFSWVLFLITQDDVYAG